MSSLSSSPICRRSTPASVALSLIDAATRAVVRKFPLGLVSMVGLLGMLHGPAWAAPDPCDDDALRRQHPDAVTLSDFGAIGDGIADESAALARAIEAAGEGGVVFVPRGTFAHRRLVVLDRPGLQLIGLAGARLHALRPSEAAIMLSASRTAVRCLIVTSVARRRGTAPWEAAIAAYPQHDEQRRLSDIEITDNRIVPSIGADGRRHASATSGGIFVFRTSRFKVTGNHVERTLADGIHVTAGSHDGLIASNRVSDTGDDMIAVVSYLGDTTRLARLSDERIQHERASNLVRDIEIRDNVVRTAYWGRGITVVGGERVRIHHNRIDDVKMAAGILVSREESWKTFGVSDIDVHDNTVTNTQTIPGALGPMSDQAAIEIQNFATKKMLGDQRIAPLVSNGEIRIRDNRVMASRRGAIRLSTAANGTRLDCRGNTYSEALDNEHSVAAECEGIR